MIRPGLGTAQLGMPYGAHIESGTLPASSAAAILGKALKSGISFIDTASAYGESERRIGDFLRNCPSPGEIVICTKLPRVDEAVWRDTAAFLSAVRSSLYQSATLLGADRIHMVLTHQCETSFLSAPQVSEALLEVTAEYPTYRFGVSVYTVEEAMCALGLPWVSALQFPVNILDQRFLDREFLSRCQQGGILRIARSLFLQGILTSHSPIPPVRKSKSLARLRRYIVTAIEGLPLEEVALQYIFGVCAELLDIGLLGVHSVQELEVNLQILGRIEPLPENVLHAIEEARTLSDQENLFDPRTWNI